MKINSQLSGSDVKRIRNQMELSQEDFATAIASSTSTVNRWEVDGCKASPASTLLRLLDRFPTLLEAAASQTSQPPPINAMRGTPDWFRLQMLLMLASTAFRGDIWDQIARYHKLDSDWLYDAEEARLMRMSRSKGGQSPTIPGPIWKEYELLAYKHWLVEQNIWKGKPPCVERLDLPVWNARDMKKALDRKEFGGTE